MEENMTIETAVAQENATDDINDCEENEAFEKEGSSQDEEDTAKNVSLSEKEEYERLIKHRFKELYAADAQKLINRRFRKYKVLEERYKIMEETLREKEAALSESLKKLDAFGEQLTAECEKVAKETEERLLAGLRVKRMRPTENGLRRGGNFGRPDVSHLTKSDRARLAERAAGGEKIKL